MSSIFLSHNHRDKPFVRRLGQDLQAEGILVWIDEAEILVGDSLIGKIETGIDGMDYLGVVLSNNSVQSEWVNPEVRIALDREINHRRVTVLPILIEECPIPGFLRGKAYAQTAIAVGHDMRGIPYLSAPLDPAARLLRLHRGHPWPTTRCASCRATEAGSLP